MKTNTSDKRQVTGDRKLATDETCSCHASRVTSHPSAFTLIELLVVIAVIAILAALILPVAGAVKKKAFIQTAQAQMAQLETAIERYHSAYGFYPPSSINGPLTNQLYFELVGTTNLDVANGDFVTLDGGARISTTTGNDLGKTFGVSGFMNCNKPNTDESASHAQDFLPDLKPTQIATLYTNGNDVVKILVTSVGGPDPNYPLGMTDVNPWRYNSSNPNHNSGSYDLWIQLDIAGNTNLVCNWTKQVQINNSSVP